VYTTSLTVHPLAVHVGCGPVLLLCHACHFAWCFYRVGPRQLRTYNCSQLQCTVHDVRGEPCMSSSHIISRVTFWSHVIGQILPEFFVNNLYLKFFFLHPIMYIFQFLKWKLRCHKLWFRAKCRITNGRKTSSGLVSTNSCFFAVLQFHFQNEFCKAAMKR
jgi:hypothetical protein